LFYFGFNPPRSPQSAPPHSRAACLNCNSRKISKHRLIPVADCLFGYGRSTNQGGVPMTLSTLSVTQRIAPQETFDSNKVRTLIADYLGIDIERVTDEAHFSDEFDMDRYDCLELMILIEDAFSGVEITDDDADQIEVVGDLIRHIEDYERRGRNKLIRLT
jgi:acyl carrier protein